MAKRIYLIEQYRSGEERIVASAPCEREKYIGIWTLSLQDEEQIAFLRKAQLFLNFGRHEFQLPDCHVEDFLDVVHFMENQKDSSPGPFITCKRDYYSVHIMDEDNIPEHGWTK